MTEIEKQVEEKTNEVKALTSILIDPENFNIKHPLYSSWTLYYDLPLKKATQQSWSLNIKKVAKFNTIEDFWGVINAIPTISKLASSSSYHLFRDDIKPEWEDPKNAKGGRWLTTIQKNPNHSLDDNWQNILLACVGESFEYPDQINGAVVSNRNRGDRLSLWTSKYEEKDQTLSVGHHFKSLISGPPNLKYQFYTHEDGKTNNNPKEKYSI